MTTTTTAQATTTGCCTTHDGGHVHGCDLPRDESGRTHGGECQRAGATTTAPRITTLTRYPFCPAWCLGHDDEAPYLLDEDNIEQGRWVPGTPEVEVGDVLFIHCGESACRLGRSELELRRIDVARGGNVVTGGGTLTTGEVMVLIQGEGVAAPAVLTTGAASVLAADIIAMVDALENPEDHGA